MTSRTTTVLIGVNSLFAGLVIPVANAQRGSGPVKVVQLTGLVGVKDNAKGALSVENGQLHFVHSKASSDLSASSIQDAVTAADSQRAVGGTIGLMSMAAPYGGGRVLSLFRTKIDTLTVKYRDADGVERCHARFRKSSQIPVFASLSPPQFNAKANRRPFA